MAHEFPARAGLATARGEPMIIIERTQRGAPAWTRLKWDILGRDRDGEDAG